MGRGISGGQDNPSFSSRWFLPMLDPVPSLQLTSSLAGSVDPPPTRKHGMAFASLVPGQLADCFKVLKAKSYSPPLLPFPQPCPAQLRLARGEARSVLQAGRWGRGGGIKPFIGLMTSLLHSSVGPS